MTTLLTTTQTGMLLLLLPFLVIAMSTDIAQRQIPNFLVAFMLGSGLLLHTALLGVGGLAWSLGGMGVGFLILLPFYALGGMGAGDVKLLAAAGSFLGPWGALLAGIFTLGAGGLLGVGAIVWRRLICRKVIVPLASRHQLLPQAWTRLGSDLRLPYSLAIAAGTLAAVYQLDAAGMQSPITAGVTSW